MNVAIYCRLSDEDKSKDNETVSSESIKNQILILNQYAKKNGWSIYDVYSDDDYAGSDRNRPDFKRLLNDAKKKKFNIVLCKSQSRFSREMELTEKYLHHLFPIWGIRFIGVTDNVDTADKGNKKARQLNGLVNEWYIEDLSENVKRTMDMQRREGKYVSSFACYGYKKDPENIHKLIVDEEASKIVKLIFEMYLNDNGYSTIAQHLNDLKIPTPSKYKELTGSNYKNPNKKEVNIWTASTVAYILRKRIYCGDMVQGCRAKDNYKSTKTYVKNKNEWIVVKNTHPAIISKEDFRKVQDKLMNNKKYTIKRDNHFKGKVICKCCQHTLKIKSRSKYSYLVCRTKLEDKTACSGCSISYDELERQTLYKIKKVYNDLVNPVALLENVNLVVNDNNKIMKVEISKKIDRLRQKKKQLYYQRIEGIITLSQYKNDSKDIQSSIDVLETKRCEINNYEKSNSGINDELISQIKEAINMEGLNSEIIELLLDRIEIYQQKEETKIEYYWNF